MRRVELPLLAVLLLAGHASAQLPPPPQSAPPAPAQPAPTLDAAGLAPPPPLQAGGLNPPLQAGGLNPALQAGGLNPPTTLPSSEEPSALDTERQLETAEREDSGRGLQIFWLNGAVGGAHSGLQALAGSNLVQPQLLEPAQTGLAYGGSLGVRLLAFSLGARFLMVSGSDYGLWTLGARGGLHIPLGAWEPYVFVGAGYAALGRAPKGTPNINGVDVFAGGGIDYYVSNVVSVGAELTGDLLLLSRAAAPSSSEASYKKSGSGTGAAGSLAITLGLHF